MIVQEHPIDGVHFDVEVTLVELRDTADDALRAYAASIVPELVIPLDLAGVYKVEPWVLDDDVDYWLADVNITLTPDMTAWNVMRVLAKAWGEYPVMNGFRFSHFGVREWGLPVILWPDVDRLEDDQLDAMPFPPEDAN